VGQQLPRRRLHGRLRLEALTLRHPAAPVAVVALVAAAWLIGAPPVADLAAHEYRAWLFDTEGIPALWNLQWYGGHHVPGYSLIFPPLAGILGAREAVALCGVAAAAALVRLAGEHTLAAWLLAAAAAANLVTGRGPFLMGIALAALALQWPRDSGRARLAALLTAAASPVAALFLCLVALVDRRFMLALGPAALVLALAVFFPEGGAERFVATAFWPMLALTLAAAWLLPDRWRLGALAYAVALCAAFLVDTPMGQNAARLGVLAGPAALAVAGRGPRPALIAVGAGLLYLSVLPAVRAVVESRGDPATEAAFHAPLLEFLDRAAAPGDRVEVAFTRNHWEAAHVARHRPIARGWERQLDLKYNGLFYDGTFSAATYERWLRREGIRWVALPDAPLDFSARAEAALLRRGAGFLRPAFSGEGWRVWELRDAPPPVAGPGRIVSTGPQRLVLHADAAGTLRLRFRWTTYWTVTKGRARLRERDGRLEVEALRPGAIELESGNTPG
jgi:hypothetical protein